MEKGFVLLREYIYGWDFTEWDGDENIVIHDTVEEAETELVDVLDHEKEIGGGDPLMIAHGHVDQQNYVVASDDNGAVIVRSEEPLNI